MRSVMNDFENKNGFEPQQPRWEGIAELDRALAENRLTAYRWKKAWADPWGRALGLFVITVFAAYVAAELYWNVFQS